MIASSRAWALGAALVAVAVLLPTVASAYLISLAVVALYYAYVGQAWNVIMGFCGQLSLGHSLYVGIAAYAAAVLFVKWGVSPVIGLPIAAAIAAAAGAVVGFLAFRFGISGVYFALLTIAFAEFTRIGFDHFPLVGGSGGFFLPVDRNAGFDPLNLRGSPVMFYYILLGLTVAAFALCGWFARGRIGHYWMAIRENPEAAAALGVDLFRYKMAAMIVSSGMTGVAGVIFAFYYNSLFPEQIFNMGRSIELILGPIIGGLGTLFGPILGAVVLAAMAEGLDLALGWLGLELPGAKQVFYGVCLGLTVIYLPHGIWPALARRLGIAR